MERSLLKDSLQKLKILFVAIAGGRTLFGASAVEETRVKELIPVMTKSLYGEPATYGFFLNQVYLLEVMEGRSIDLDIIGPDLNTITATAQKAAGLVMKEFPRSAGNQMRPKPGLILGAPEIQIVPSRIKLADNNVTASELSAGIDAFNSGIRIDEITVESKRMDLTLMGEENSISETQGIENIPIVTTSGKLFLFLFI